MLTNATPAVDRALEVAQKWAHGLGAAEVQPLHLLQGLLAQEEGRAATMLAAAGVELAAFQHRFSGSANATLLPSPATPLPVGAQARDVLNRASHLARETTADRTVMSDHLVWALIATVAELRANLETFGLNVTKLEQEVVSWYDPPLALEEPLDLDEPTERMGIARILDATANRAREALRVVEDYCRFVLEDAYLSGELKQLRHDLAETLEEFPATTRLEARETLRDVGTTLSTAREQHRQSLLAVVQANLKRLQEALRSLEEFSKVRSPRAAERLERMRYHSYTLERAIVLGTTARERLTAARLYVLVSGLLCTAALDWTIQEAAAGGAQIIQLREKGLNDRDLLDRARKVRRWTAQWNLLFIMNDRPDIARLVEADGVHVGQEELPVKEVRHLLGPNRLVGVSTHNLDQVRQAVLDGASYIGVGPTFPSGTKGFADFPGLDFVRRVAAETSLPAFVIGGVTPRNIAEVVAAGGWRVAVSQAICQADDPRAVAAELRTVLDTAPLPAGPIC